ncbi:DUF5123 domain-containing protein [Niastella vici]|nr:DUF5123 domain-containing protein [Niastella vici]
MKSTNINKIFLTAVIAGLICTGIISCKKFNDWDADASYNRLFTPSDLAASVDGVNVTLKWKAKPNTDSYTIEFSKDSLKFTTIIRKYSTRGTKNTDGYTYFAVPDQFDQVTQYSVRVKGIDSAGTPESNWAAILFKSGKFPSILNSATISDITDVAIRASWTNTGDAATTIKILKAGDSSVVKTVTLTSTDLTNQYTVISGLTPATGYILYIYSGTKVRGWYDFSTKATLSGSVIDLRSITGVPSILADTLPDIAAGSTVILKKGTTYEMTNSYSFNKTVSIISGDDLTTTTPATIYFKGTTGNNFDVVSGSVIDSISLTNVIITSDDVSASAKYAFNISQPCTIGKISLESCTGQYFRGLIRTKDNTMNISTISINNCIVSDLGSYGLITVDNAANKIDNILVTNSTIYRVGATVVKNVRNSLTSVIKIEYCTVNEAPLYANYLIDLNTFTVTTGISINNNIFGVGKASGANVSVKGCRSGTTATGTGNYTTSDYISSGNALPGVTAYAGASTALFTDVVGGNFKVTDGTFGGKSSAGDPRWWWH